MKTRSPLAPDNFPPLPAIAGVRLSACAAGVKYSGRTDVMVAEVEDGTQVAGVFTKSLCPSAPVDWCRQVLPTGTARVVLVNSGNANAFTGKKGVRSVERSAQAAAKTFGCKPEEVYLASTGVIGVELPDNVITGVLPGLKQSLDGNAWQLAAEAIMTTDTFPKGATRKAKIAGTEVTINGFAKGSGMIAPDMATMLGFVFTDANIPAEVLQACLKTATESSFNCVTVDSDTSTSDTVLLFATGKVEHKAITSLKDSHLRDFKRALTDLLVDLAKQLVKDGEGAENL